MKLLIAVLLLFAGAGADFNNYWDRPLSFTCKSRRFIRKIYSEHSNHHEDRRWDLGCSSLPGVSSSAQELCHTSAYVNDFDRPFSYHCPYNGYITGMYSYHDNFREDRRWKFRCCRLSGYHIQDCSSTWANGWDAVMNFYVPSGFVLTGVYSYHSNYREDRRWKYTYCRVKKASG